MQKNPVNEDWEDISDKLTPNTTYFTAITKKFKRKGNMYFLSFNLEVKTAFNSGVQRQLFTLSDLDINNFKADRNLVGMLASSGTPKGVALLFVTSDFRVLSSVNGAVGDYIQGECLYVV